MQRQTNLNSQKKENNTKKRNMNVTKKQIQDLKVIAENLDPDNDLSNTLNNIIAELEPVAEGDKILSSWSIEDLKGDDWKNSGLNDEDARKILANVKNKHDASLGINWDFLEACKEYYIINNK